MTTRTLIVASVAAWVAALVGLVWMVVLAEFRPRYLPGLLTEMDMALQACAVLSVVSAAIGVIGVRAGARRRAVLGFAAAFGWGVLGALYGAANARIGLIDMNPPIPFSVYAPNYAEAFLVLLVGLTGALLGVALLGRRSPRWDHRRLLPPPVGRGLERTAAQPASWRSRVRSTVRGRFAASASRPSSDGAPPRHLLPTGEG